MVIGLLPGLDWEMKCPSGDTPEFYDKFFKVGSASHKLVLRPTEVLSLRKLFQLSSHEAWILLQAAVLLPIARLFLEFITVARMQRLVARALRAPRSRRMSPQATARMVRIAAHRGLYRFKCLDQSLVLGWLLRRQGIDARILFGARKEDNQMQAHAWVEVGGMGVSDDEGEHQRFSPLEEITPSISN